MVERSEGIDTTVMVTVFLFKTTFTLNELLWNSFSFIPF